MALYEHIFLARQDVTAQQVETMTEQFKGIIEANGGKYLSRGGDLKVLEGNWDLHRIVTLEFPDRAAFERWYHGAEYQALKVIRDRTVRTNAFTFGGFEA